MIWGKSLNSSVPYPSISTMGMRTAMWQEKPTCTRLHLPLLCDASQFMSYKMSDAEQVWTMLIYPSLCPFCPDHLQRSQEILLCLMEAKISNTGIGLNRTQAICSRGLVTSPALGLLNYKTERVTDTRWWWWGGSQRRGCAEDPAYFSSPLSLHGLGAKQLGS